MNSETVNIAYEAIDNPVLRLLIIFGVAVVSALAAAVVYLYRERQSLQREMIDMNRESIRVFESIENAMENHERMIVALTDALKNGKQQPSK